MYNLEELTEKVHRLKELMRQAEDINTTIDNIKNDIKAHMEKNDLTELVGEDWKVTWKSIDSMRFDQKSFSSKHPELFESFKVSSSSRRFDVK